MLEYPGRSFQRKTRYHRNAMEDHELDWRSKPPRQKFYPQVPVISLPDPAPMAETTATPDLWRCISQRRSVRSYGTSPLSLDQLSRLLWASAGTTLSFITPHGQDFYRAAPSAGALYPIETYLVVNRVQDLDPGLYHYRVTGLDILERPMVEGGHALELLREGDLGTQINQAALDQPMCAKSGAVFIWSAVFARSVWKYRERAYRYVYLDVAHMAAQLSLAAVALGLGSCPIAAFYDDEANALLGIDGEEESVLYMTSVGNPARPVRSDRARGCAAHVQAQGMTVARTPSARLGLGPSPFAEVLDLRVVDVVDRREERHRFTVARFDEGRGYLDALRFEPDLHVPHQSSRKPGTPGPRNDGEAIDPSFPAVVGSR